MVLSRTDADFVRKIIELEVPETYDKTVEIYKIVREPGYRTKVAVYSRREDIDPVGACVGLKGVRIQAVIRELEGEKIDILKYDADPREFIKNALSPAEVTGVIILDENKRQALAIVPESQFSLALGKQGFNVRLANRLVDWNIDVKTEDDTDCYVEFTAVAGSDQNFSIAFQGPENGSEDIQMVVEAELVDSNTESDQAGSPVQLTVKALQNPEPVQGNDNTDVSVTPKTDADDPKDPVTGNPTTEKPAKEENSRSDTTTSEFQGNADSEARVPQLQSLAEPGDSVRVEYDGLTVIAETATSPNRVPAIDEDGGLRFYTGETAMTTISVSSARKAVTTTCTGTR